MANRLPSHLNFSTNPETGKDEYYCIPCNRVFRSRTQKYYHYNCNNDEQKKYKCEHCQQSFSTRSHLNYHLEKHRDATYKCTECSKLFSNRLVFKKHVKLHQQKHLFNCAFCQKKFRSKETLNAHIARHENALKFECNDCDKKYANKSALEQHKLKHLAKKHKCPHCGKSFQRNSILNIHLKRHNANEFFVCTTCSKKFSDSGALQRHAKTHRTEEVIKYKCNECQMTTTRKDNIQRHVRNMHNGESFDNCVEILAPAQPLVASQELKMLPEKPLESVDRNLPKTVANSSVIKFVGNVEPIVVVAQGESSDGSETPNETEERTFAILETVKNVDAKKKYDPIEMYRKILNSDERDESTDHINHDETPDQCEPVMAAKRSSNFANSNFSEMHWRKNFKHTYTQHQGY